MSRELHDIYTALQEGLAACDALDTWVRGVDARDRLNSRRWSLKRGVEAYERLSRDLRDGRKHVEVHDESNEDVAHAANLTEPDEGHRLCDTCEGQGTGMEMVCYGGPPCERTTTCPDCDGEGQIEAPAPTTTKQD